MAFGSWMIHVKLAVLGLLLVGTYGQSSCSAGCNGNQDCCDLELQCTNTTTYTCPPSPEPWCSARAVYHYRCGEGADVPLTETGHEPYLYERLLDLMDAIHRYVCRYRNSPELHYKYFYVPHDATQFWRCDWWIGGFAVKVTNFIVAEQCPMNPAEVTVDLVMCDAFEDPLYTCGTLPEEFEMFGGKVFYVKHIWTHTFECPCDASPAPVSTPTPMLDPTTAPPASSEPPSSSAPTLAPTPALSSSPPSSSSITSLTTNP